MTIVNDIDLSTIRLDKGSHDDHTPGSWCVMEAVAWVAGEPWTDRPECVSPVISRYCIGLNDRLNDVERQKLAPYIFKVIGTNTGEADDEKRRLLASQMFTSLLPDWLALAGLPDHAERVRALGPLTTYEQWSAARSVLNAARDAAWNKRWEHRDAIKAKVREALKDNAVDNAVAAAAAVAVAAADADAVADAVAAAVAVAAAAAAADAVADADAVAAAVAASSYGKTYDAVRKAVLPICERAIAENPDLSAMVERTRTMGLDLLDAMCAVGREA